MVKIKIRKKRAIFLSAFLLVFAVVGYAFAFGGSNPSVIGHSGNEIQVTVDGETKLLNDALNDLKNSGGSSNNWGTKDCYIYLPSDTTTSFCKDGFYLKAMFKKYDDKRDFFGQVCCRISNEDTSLPSIEEILDACPWGISQVNCLDGQTYPTGQYSIKTFGRCENFGSCSCPTGSNLISKIGPDTSCSISPSQVDTLPCSASSGSNSWSTCCVCERI